MFQYFSVHIPSVIHAFRKRSGTEYLTGTPENQAINICVSEAIWKMQRAKLATTKRIKYEKNNRNQIQADSPRLHG